MAFCMNCGSQLPDGSRFCGNCGTPQGDMPAGGAFRITITYADGTTEKMIFYHSNGVMKNGKYNGCSKQLYFAMNKLIHERLGLE